MIEVYNPLNLKLPGFSVGFRCCNYLQFIPGLSFWFLFPYIEFFRVTLLIEAISFFRSQVNSGFTSSKSMMLWSEVICFL